MEGLPFHASGFVQQGDLQAECPITGPVLLVLCPVCRKGCPALRQAGKCKNTELPVVIARSRFKFSDIRFMGLRLKSSRRLESEMTQFVAFRILRLSLGFEPNPNADVAKATPCAITARLCGGRFPGVDRKSVV